MKAQDGAIMEYQRTYADCMHALVCLCVEMRSDSMKTDKVWEAGCKIRAGFMSSGGGGRHVVAPALSQPLTTDHIKRCTEDNELKGGISLIVS
jgi:hypothetical protein